MLIDLKKKIYTLYKKINLALYIHFNPNKKESVFFYTFHKCASTLFSTYILKNIEGLKNKDYALFLMRKPNDFNKALDFHNKGFIYGPIRLSAYHSLVDRLLIAPTSDYDFIKKKSAIFFVRDPRDILISKYYSFGFTHSLSPIKEKREELLKIRKEIQSKTIDQYVLDNAEEEIKYFNKMTRLAQQSKNHVILRYEDMIEDFDSFISKLGSIVNLEPEVIDIIYEKSRPKTKIDESAHRRSGSIRQFEKELKAETISSLNLKLHAVLKDYNYRI